MLCEFLERVEALDTLHALTSIGQLFGASGQDFPDRKIRIDFATQQNESNGSEWEVVVSSSTDEVTSTFDSMIARIAHHIRENLAEVEG